MFCRFSVLHPVFNMYDEYMFLFLSYLFHGFYRFILVSIAYILCVLPQSLKGEETDKDKDFIIMNSSYQINFSLCDFLKKNQVDRDNINIQTDIKSGDLHNEHATSSNKSEQGDCTITSETWMAEKCMKFPQESSLLENDLSGITVSDLSTPSLNTNMDRDDAINPSSFSESELQGVQ